MQAEITDLRAALNRAEQLEIHRCDHIAILKKNCDEMESKLAVLEAQEPVGYFYCADNHWQQAHDPIGFAGHTKLYAAAGAAPVPSDWKDAVSMAYGHLWHFNNEPMAPIPLRSDGEASYAARKLLRDLLTTDERGQAINAVRELLAAAPKEQT